MAASWYKLYITTFDFVDDTKSEVELRFVWEGLNGTERDFTDKFEIFTRYHVVNNKGERRIDREDPSTTITPIPGQTEYVYYWDVPDRCVEVEMKVVAYSKTYNSNGNQVPHWDIGLTKEVTTGTDEGIVHWLYCGESHKPDRAATPTVTQNPRLGTQVALELSDIRETEGNNKDVTKVEFQVLSFENEGDTGSIVAGTHEAIVTDLNSCRYVVSIGNSYGYKFRARYWAGKAGESSKISGDPWAANASPIVDIAGEWSELTDMVYGVPNTPAISEMKKQNRTQLYMKFDCEGYWHHLQMQVASTKSAFEKMDTWEIEHPDAIEDQDTRSAEILIPPPLIAEITIPEHTVEYLYDYPTTQGGRLFYRVRAVSAESEGFYSGWSEVKEFQFLEGLKKPMVWMNTPYTTVGENYITLNFMHNSPTGTQTTGAQIMYRVNSGTLRPYPPTGIIDPPSNSNVYQLAFPLSDFTEECVINWQVRTCEFGEAGQDERHWSEFSDDMQFWVYEKPEIEIEFPDIPDNEWIPANIENESSTIPVISQFPFHFIIKPILGGEQSVTSYLIRIIALEAYGEYDGYGNKKFINAGEVLYSAYDNTSKGSVDKYLSVTDCTLSNGKRYELSVIAYINTGVVAKTEAMFTVNIPQPDYVLEASVAENADNVSMLINPRAVKYEGTGLITDEHWEHLDWEDGIVNGSCVFFDGENAHYTINEKDYIFYPAVSSEAVRTYPKDITLSIYRKNQDGTMVAIAENLTNADSVYISDPHPHLMKNSYRIVGKNINSGTMTFADTPEYTMHCTDIVIQWDENVHFTDVNENNLPSEYAGNILRLPYNVDVSETAGVENNMVKYIGRKDPVSYYGTQTGYTASWNTVIPKSDRETIALLRKLQVWPGDCYVREPSGTGYWANVKVTFPINHIELTVSVSITITRVEGGM